jgi:hypothetical protein
MKISMMDHINAIYAEKDLRDQQRYDAQTKAVEAAFLAQQTAMQAALLAAEKAVQTALTAAEKAVTKAETASEKRFDGVNEFRKAYADLIALMMTRAETESRMLALSEKIDELKSTSSERTGKTENSHAIIGYAIGIAGIVIAIVAFITR